MKQKLILLISVVIGLLAFFLSRQYLARERERLYAGAERVEVIAARVDLAAGTVLRIEDLRAANVFRTAVGEQAVRLEDVDHVLGKRLQFPMRRDDPLLWTYVDLPERVRGGLAPMIQPGLRAISLAIGGDAAVSGHVQPNDRVDILGTFSFPTRQDPAQVESVTLTLLQDVSVLATGPQLARFEPGMGAVFEGRAGGYSTVTFEVTPREAELLVFAQHTRGQMTLSLRHPEDMGFEPELPTVNFDHLEGHLEEYNRFRQRVIRRKQEP